MQLLEIHRLRECSPPARRLVPRPSPRGRTDFQRVHPELLLRVQRCELDAELAGTFSVGPRLKSSPEEDSRRTCRTRVSSGGNLQHEVLKARAEQLILRFPGLLPEPATREVEMSLRRTCMISV